eukprot:TRINITY_DN1062_c0_g1_i1.p1 TRINITY_DN1062_c0_g1~~TRINITY_DN1062_c0_g1_i1.p1  ORF type:complete len:124 (-),score=16.54 TRINITY_DN1062_c0_g1_i1:185-556(-)
MGDITDSKDKTVGYDSIKSGAKSIHDSETYSITDDSACSASIKTTTFTDYTLSYTVQHLTRLDEVDYSINANYMISFNDDGTINTLTPSTGSSMKTMTKKFIQPRRLLRGRRLLNMFYSFTHY